MVTTPAVQRRSPAIERASLILDELSQRPLGLADLSDRVRLAKSSVSDICSTLVSTGLVTRNADGHYRLGSRFAELSRQASPSPMTVEAFNRAVSEGTALDGHTLSLGTMVGNELLTLNVRLGRHPLPLTPRPGTRSPLVECAAGPALAATLGDALDAELDLFARHQALDEEGRAAIHAAAVAARGAEVFRWESRAGAQQAACAVHTPGETTLTAVTLHLPDTPQSAHDFASLTDALMTFSAGLA